MSLLDFGLLDVWNHPALKMTRGVIKLGASAISSASAKAEDFNLAPSELMDMRDYARAGDSNAQVLLALHYAENDEFELVDYWLNQSAKQGNEVAQDILDSLQEG